MEARRRGQGQPATQQRVNQARAGSQASTLKCWPVPPGEQKMTEPTRTFQLKFRIWSRKTLVSVPALRTKSPSLSELCPHLHFGPRIYTASWGLCEQHKCKRPLWAAKTALEHLPSGSRYALCCHPSSDLRRARVPGGERDGDQQTSKTEKEVSSVTEHWLTVGRNF